MSCLSVSLLPTSATHYPVPLSYRVVDSEKMLTQRMKPDSEVQMVLRGLICFPVDSDSHNSVIKPYLLLICNTYLRAIWLCIWLFKFILHTSKIEKPGVHGMVAGKWLPASPSYPKKIDRSIWGLSPDGLKEGCHAQGDICCWVWHGWRNVGWGYQLWRQLLAVNRGLPLYTPQPHKEIQLPLAHYLHRLVFLKLIMFDGKALLLCHMSLCGGNQSFLPSAHSKLASSKI